MEASKILIVGANGQLGQALRSYYPDAFTVDAAELNIADTSAVQDFDWSPFQVVINAAAYTDVDCAETTDGRRTAWSVNAAGPRNLALAALVHDLTLVHISTDYVFDGRRNVHLEDEPLSPLGVYGQSKAAGDTAVSLAPRHYILRTSWVIGEGKNFVRTMLSLGSRGVAPSVVDDQIGRLTFTRELVTCIDHLLSTAPAYGVYNVTNDGESVSWADVARKVFSDAGYDISVTGVTTAEYYTDTPGIAPRPLTSTLHLGKLQATGYQPEDWRTALTRYIRKEQTS